jgi:hypothetical protein
MREEQCPEVLRNIFIARKDGVHEEFTTLNIKKPSDLYRKHSTVKMCNLHIGPHIRNKTCIHSFSGKIY